MRLASFFQGLCGRCLVAAAFPALAFAVVPVDPYLVVVHRVSGDASIGGVAIKAGDLPDSGSVFKTGSTGSLTLRFHPDLMTLESRAKARFEVGYARTDSGGARRVQLFEGRLLAGLSLQGPGLQMWDTHSRLRAGEGRVSFATVARASVIVVLEGQAEVQNLATGSTRILKRGDKAVSDAGGLRVTRAQSAELADAGLGQNILEVDFWNPVTGDFRTLEVEYEKSP
jgi:hypothetical protein